jgi:hypothetical protein
MIGILGEVGGIQTTLLVVGTIIVNFFSRKLLLA